MSVDDDDNYDDDDKTQRAAIDACVQIVFLESHTFGLVTTLTFDL